MSQLINTYEALAAAYASLDARTAGLTMFVARDIEQLQAIYAEHLIRIACVVTWSPATIYALFRGASDELDGLLDQLHAALGEPRAEAATQAPKKDKGARVVPPADAALEIIGGFLREHIGALAGAMQRNMSFARGRASREERADLPHPLKALDFEVVTIRPVSVGEAPDEIEETEEAEEAEASPDAVATPAPAAATEHEALFVENITPEIIRRLTEDLTRVGEVEECYDGLRRTFSAIASASATHPIAEALYMATLGRARELGGQITGASITERTILAQVRAIEMAVERGLGKRAADVGSQWRDFAVEAQALTDALEG